ncbi:MAG: 16S rRNA (adenine(1518)-N(6)/adenine(1519)-N(6))-dimethyltransferase RsmA [Nitrospinota bacterium]
MKKSGRQRLGQHFLADSEIRARIVEAVGIKEKENVLEIGPGRGALTGMLYRNVIGLGGTLTLIEPDKKFYPYLIAECPGVELMEERAERVNLSELPGPLVVVSNLPYYASVQIYKQCIEHKENISRMVLMFQKEVAKRIAANPGIKSYGSLSVLSRYHWKMEEIITVPASAFRPKPKVDSAVLGFIPHTKPPVDAEPEILFPLVRAAFTHKRRTLKNNLKNIYRSESIEEAFRAANVNEKARAETVSLEQFAAMAGPLDGQQIAQSCER